MYIKIHKSSSYIKYKNKIIFQTNGLLGSRFYSNRCGAFVVIEKTSKAADRRYLYKIQFELTNTVCIASQKKIISGEIKDRMYPTICDIGFHGLQYEEIMNNDIELCRILYKRWKNMILRVYNENDLNYCNYGGKGILVDKRWHNFSNFYYDITSMNDFNRDSFLNENIEIDKDLKQIKIPINKRVYSKDTVSLISHKDNMKYMDIQSSANKQSSYFVKIDSSQNEILEKNISNFSKNHNIDKFLLWSVIMSNQNKEIAGYKYRNITNYEMHKIKLGLLHPGDLLNSINNNRSTTILK